MSSTSHNKPAALRRINSPLLKGPLLSAAFAAVLALASTTGAQAQTQGGTLRAIVQPEPPMLMLGLNQQIPTQYVAGKIYESLLTWSPDLKPQPGLARAWHISDDGKTYTFDLQQGVTWHDGKPFSADDVVFSIDKFLRAVHPRARVIINQFVDSVTALAPDKVEIKLKTPFAPFLKAFVSDNMPIVPKHLYDGTDYLNNPNNQHPIGTGPFMFKNWNKGSVIELARNPYYWQKGKPYLDGIVFSVIPDSASRAVAFERGDVDVLRSGDVDNVDIKRLKALPGVDYTTNGWEMFAQQAYIQMNQRKPPFDNVKVRQAVMYALNRKFIVDNIFFGLGKVSTGPISSKTPFYSADVTQYPYDIKKARALVKESGVDVSKPIKILSYPYGAAWDRLGEYTRQALQQIGFNVDMEAADAGTWSKRVADFDFDLTFSFTSQYGDPALGVSRLFLTRNIVKGSAFVNNVGYKNAEADALWDKAATATSDADRAQAYQQVQKMLVDDVANGYLFEIENPTLYRAKVHNLVKTAIGLNDTFADVYIDK
ncbi:MULTISPECIES: ABC transporter substrate-binding protein [unclassified Achromobacter]|uniref:ABC transporter substrate-binding protein n=1 Tax=unclassified Achromobacter TaxID=2626865 RepID=UPI000B517489|nr:MULTISPECIES: ABC transporter substrate-binding protein [unclassified Achromobacter]OWT80173.1 peptide ABC transporter substrate-binding protein [Achromobacter sp. HZ34]OWT82056.1 peptide ABC transporter substrate-binding protein [Achromobacter sp. HZ28]